jgi:hypothetical protein
MSAGVENEAAVARQLADPNSELPPGARRMTQPEREERMEAICSALLKQVRCSKRRAIVQNCARKRKRVDIAGFRACFR